MDATSGRDAVLTTHGRGRRRALGSVLTAAVLAVGLMAATAAPASAATCSGAGAVQAPSYDVLHAPPRSPDLNLTDLTGRVGEGDTIVASFTIPQGCSDVLVTLISYFAPGPAFDRGTAHTQNRATASSASFSEGRHTGALSITVQPCYFQVDLVQGRQIGRFGYGAGGEGFYSDQGRLVDAANGGTHTCPPGTVGDPAD
jgi:hypothetical protein